MFGVSVNANLKKLGGIGNFLATALTFLTTNWTLAIGTLVALVAGLSNSFFEFVGNPRVITAAEVFIFALWTCVGISILSDRNRPKAVKPMHDYAYALVNEGASLFFDKDQNSGLNIGVNFKNYSNGPLRLKLDDLRVVIGDRTVPSTEIKEFVIPRGGGRGIASGLFSKETIEDIKKADPSKPSGYLELSARYGHPDFEFVRIYKVKFQLTIKISDEPAILGGMESESDLPWSAPT